MPHQPPYHAFSDTLYTSLCQIAEVALNSNHRTNALLQPAELVHECFLKLLSSETAAPADPVEFRALAATMIRQALVDHVRRERTLKRGDDWAQVALEDEELELSERLQFDVLVLDEALVQLAAINARQARIVELRFFSGLSIIEVAQAIDIAPRTVNADWKVARTWLRRALT